MKANIARQIEAARNRFQLWGREGGRARWQRYRRANPTTNKQRPVGEEQTSQPDRTAGAKHAATVNTPTSNGVNAGGEWSAGSVRPASEGAMLPRVHMAPQETTRQAIEKLEAAFPHLRTVRITETDEDIAC